MREIDRIHQGILFSPSNPDLKAIKRRAHKLSQLYSRTFEDEVEERTQLLGQLLGRLGPGASILGPIFFHYGIHTEIGTNFFANYNLTVQDDAKVSIGHNVNFGPNVTIVTPLHPMVAAERRQMLGANRQPTLLCHAAPVVIGNDVWVSAGATICPGVTIGDGSIIGAGSVVTRDVAPNSFAAGVPCKVVRPITDADSMRFKPGVLADCLVIQDQKHST